MDISLVKEFYKCLELVSGGETITVSTKVGKYKLSFTEKDLGTILGIPCDGYDDFLGGIPVDATEAEVTEAVMGTGKFMPVVSRVLHEYLALCLLPRGVKHTVPTVYEEVILWKLLTKSPVNLPRIIIQLMLAVKKSQSKKFPYARLIKQILLHFSAYSPKNEICCSRQLNDGHLGRINYVWKNGVGWVHKHTVSDEATREEKGKEVVTLDDDTPDGQEQDADARTVSERKEIIRMLHILNEKMDKLLLAAQIPSPAT